jgi:hypothetical protein
VRTSANEVKKEKETARENVCCLHFIDENYFFPFFLKLFFFSFSFPGFCVFFPFWVCLGRRELWKDISGRDRTKEDIKNPSHVRAATNGRGSLAEKKTRQSGVLFKFDSAGCPDEKIRSTQEK